MLKLVDIVVILPLQRKQILKKQQHVLLDYPQHKHEKILQKKVFQFTSYMF